MSIALKTIPRVPAETLLELAKIRDFSERSLQKSISETRSGKGLEAPVGIAETIPTTKLNKLDSVSELISPSFFSIDLMSPLFCVPSRPLATLDTLEESLRQIAKMSFDTGPVLSAETAIKLIRKPIKSYKHSYALRGKWSIHEAVILMLGYDPEICTHSRCSSENFRRKNSEFCDQYFKIIRIIETHNFHVGSGDGFFLSDQIISPPHFIEWADKMGLGFPKDIKEMVRRYHGTTNCKQLYEEEKTKNAKLNEENQQLKYDKRGLQQSLNIAQTLFSGLVDAKVSDNNSRIGHVETALLNQGIQHSKTTIKKHYQEGKVVRKNKENLMEE